MKETPKNCFYTDNLPREESIRQDKGHLTGAKQQLVKQTKGFAQNEESNPIGSPEECNPVYK